MVTAIASRITVVVRAGIDGPSVVWWSASTRIAHVAGVAFVVDVRGDVKGECSRGAPDALTLPYADRATPNALTRRRKLGWVGTRLGLFDGTEDASPPGPKSVVVVRNQSADQLFRRAAAVPGGAA